MKAPTLHARLTRASVLTTLVALALNATLTLGYELQRFRHDAVEDLHTQEIILARAVTPSLVFNDPAAAEQQLSSLAEKQQVRAAVLFTAAGIPFAHYAAEGADTARLPLRNPLPRLGSRSAGEDLELAYDVYHDGERVGTLYLRARDEVWRRLAGYAAIQALVMAASLALAVVVFGRIQARITRPIARVAAVAQQVVERRDWRLRAPATDSREIAVLVEAFNRMLGEMESNAERLGLEVEVRQQAEEGLRMANRRKDEFLATLAHEIRNPLAPMVNAVSLLRLPDGSPALRERAVGILDRQLRHVVRLIDDLLDVSRITTGKLSLHMENVDLHAVLRAAVELIEPVARDRRLQLESAVPAEPCPVVGDAARLLQVFSNLLTNACRYTPAGGRIGVRARPAAAGLVAVDIDDTGVGVDPSMQERIFELFEQGDKSLERGNTGLGIGLTLARQLVRLHGGTIAVASRGRGHGSTFTVELPIPDGVPLTDSERAAAAAPGSAAGRRVLVADDNVDFAASLQAALESAGVEVTTVHDGRAALEAALAQRFDAAILDIGMPGMNGYDLARRLRAQPATVHMALFAVSGWGQASDRELAGAAGFDRHFVKPVAPGVLIEALAAIGGTASQEGVIG
jgi:signal transduction histidine kinase/ActR/RegA family two-component response regulator